MLTDGRAGLSYGTGDQGREYFRSMAMGKVSKTDAEWREMLSPEAYKVARKGGTERAFTGPFGMKVRRALPLRMLPAAPL